MVVSNAKLITGPNNGGTAPLYRVAIMKSRDMKMAVVSTDMK